MKKRKQIKGTLFTYIHRNPQRALFTEVDSAILDHLEYKLWRFLSPTLLYELEMVVLDCLWDQKYEDK